jgi:hypothetical protein
LNAWFEAKDLPIMSKEELDFDTFMPNFRKDSKPSLKARLIKASVIKFKKEKKRWPEKEECWQYIIEKPPNSYTTSRAKDKGEEAIQINNGVFLTKDSFRNTWKNYQKPRVETVSENLEKMES